LLLLLCNFSLAMVFPGANWQTATPESQGVDSAKLNEAVNYLKANTGTDGVRELVIVRNGYIIHEGDNTQKVHGVWSFTKSFTSTALGLLVDDGKATVDTYAKVHLSILSSQYPTVKLKHFATMTSGYYAEGDEPIDDYTHGPSKTPFIPSTPLFSPPGSKYAYWDSAMNQFANVLTRIAREPLETLFKRRIAEPIQMNRAQWDWKDFGIIDGIVVNGGAGNGNKHMFISAREAARFGLLFLNNGKWNTNQLISSDWVQKATSVQVPATLPLANPSLSSADGSGHYGYNWWVNGIGSNGKRKWPDAPPGTYAASGFNNNDMFIIPEWNMVVVRLGLDEANRKISDNTYSIFLKKIGESIQQVSGTAWQPLAIDFQGPSASESGSPNPFLDYRLQVTFTGPQGQKYNVPGFFDGDGNGGGTGNVWRVRFTPDAPGSWNYKASFVKGTNAAIQTTGGTPVSFDGQSGTFSVGSRDANAPGFLSKGRLAYDGRFHLKTMGDGKYWIKGGTDSPENLLAYTGFDNTVGSHDYDRHVQHWKTGDPYWGGGKGIIGLVNYLGSKNVNSIYFLPMNIGGDGKDVWPYSGTINPAGASSNDNTHFDISKLHQWEIVFSHAQKKGILLHFVLNEAEVANKKELDNGVLGTERKLFYREFVARFGHHNAVQWNLCEEFDTNFNPGNDQVRSWATYIRSIDPYDHPITIHNGLQPKFVIGDSRFDLTSTQQHTGNYGDLVEDYRRDAQSSGRPITISLDEFWAVKKTDDEIHTKRDWTYDSGQSFLRKNVLWPVYMSGGQLEYILSEMLASDDLAPYENMWEYTWYARKFMEDLPFWEMEPMDSLLTDEASGYQEDGQVYARPGDVYAIYLPKASPSGTLDLSGETGTFEKRWYNPRTGQFEGSATTVVAGKIALGSPPSSSTQDWALVFKRQGSVQMHVASFTLINADTDTDIRQLSDGNVITDTGNLNIRANTVPGTVGSVVFSYDGNPEYRIENVAPYALEGDDPQGDYADWIPTPGLHSLTATPYTGTGAGGTAGLPFTIDFYVGRCVHEADSDPCDGTISIGELSDYISEWKLGTVSIVNLVDAIKYWKQGL